MTGAQDTPPGTRRRTILMALVAVLVALAVGGGSYWALACPCVRTPGLYVRGTEATAPVTDWSFANKVPVCQIQVDAGLLPHAVNINCMAASTGQLYLSCAGCEGKRWSTAALANDQGWLKLDDTVYPVTLTRVLEPAELDQAWDARAVKTQNPNAVGHRDATWWSFRVTSR